MIINGESLVLKCFSPFLHYSSLGAQSLSFLFNFETEGLTVTGMSPGLSYFAGDLSFFATTESFASYFLFAALSSFLRW